MTWRVDSCIGPACPVCNPTIPPRVADQPPRREEATTQQHQHEEER